MRNQRTVRNSLMQATPTLMAIFGAFVALAPILILYLQEEGATAFWGIAQWSYLGALALMGCFICGLGVIFMIGGETEEDVLCARATHLRSLCNLIVAAHQADKSSLDNDVLPYVLALCDEAESLNKVFEAVQRLHALGALQTSRLDPPLLAEAKRNLNQFAAA